MNENTLMRAAGNVSQHLVNAARVIESTVGFSWQAKQSAPTTYLELQQAFRYSQVTGKPLPVSSEHTDSVIYTSPDVNIAYRFVHDVQHVLRGLDFTPPHELRLALLHLRMLQRSGYGKKTLEYRLFKADAIGQVRLSAIGKRFPQDQRQFTLHCLRDGIDQAVAHELRDEAVPQRARLLPVGVIAA